MSDNMIVEVSVNGDWKVVLFEEMMIGDTFRMRDPYTHEIYFNENNKSTFIATSNPFLNEDGVWTIEIEDGA
jgi:hypothetical protein